MYTLGYQLYHVSHHHCPLFIFRQKFIEPVPSVYFLAEMLPKIKMGGVAKKLFDSET